MKPEKIKELDYVRSSYKSLYDTIKSNWRKADGKFYWEISVPENTSAIIYIPSRSVWIIRSILTPYSGHTDPLENQGKQVYFNCHSGGC